MRFNLIGIIIGLRGSGKTLFVLGSELSANVKDLALKIIGLIRVALDGGMKVLIIDTIDHPSYRKIPIMPQANFIKWKSGVARIVLEPNSIIQLTDLINRSPHMNNTLIVYEDAVKYLPKVLHNKHPFVRLMVDSKQRNIDLLFMFHCFSDTPTNIFTKTDFLQIFKTQDSPKCRKEHMRLYDIVESAYMRVKNHASKFYSEYVDTRTN